MMTADKLKVSELRHPFVASNSCFMDALGAAHGDRARETVAAVSVLIIEDVVDARRMLRRLLLLDGHAVREAGDGHAGLASLLADPPDVALVDVGLPGLDGFEVARLARKNPELDGVRLVALTGYGQSEVRDALLAAGFDEHLVKPVGADELARVLAPRK
jgi:two-component system CheB/CheR fusion protein